MIHPSKLANFAYNRWFQFTFWDDGLWLAGAYWKRIVFLALLGTAAGGAYARWHPETYVSRATVRFIPPQVREDYVASNMAMQVEQRIFAVTQLVNSRLTASRLIESFNLYPQKRRLYPVADLIPEFQGNLRLVPNLEAGSKNSVPTVQISFTYSDPTKAQQVVQSVVELIYEETRRYRSDQSIGTTDFLQTELKTVTEQMSGLEKQLAELPTPGGEDHEYRNILKVEQLHDLERRLTDLQHNMQYVRGDLNLRIQLVELLEDQVAARRDLGDRKPISASVATQSLRGSLAQATARYEQLRLRYAPSNPEVQYAQRAMAKAQADLAAQEKLDREVDLAQDLGTLIPQLQRARSDQAAYQATWDKQQQEENALTTAAAQLRNQFAGTPQQEDLRLRLLREYDVAKQQYAELAKRQRESELSSDMERRGHGETAELVEPPTLPLRAQNPRNWMIVAMGTSSGLGLGFLLALLTFVSSPTVRIAQHVEMLGGYPVLISLPPGRPLKKTAGPSNSLALPQSLLLALTLSVLLTGCSSGSGTKTGSDFIAGQKAVAAGDYRSAELYFRRVLQADHRNGDAYLALSDVYTTLGNVQAAFENLERAAELLPTRPDVIERLTESNYQFYFANPGRPAAKLREVEQGAAKLMKTWPSRPSGYRLAAQVLLESHRGAEAMQLLEKALTSIEDGSLRTQLAAAYFQSGDRASAERELRTCILKNPKFTPGYDLLYLQLMESTQPDAAREVLAAKAEVVGGLDTGLQLAAHDHAAGNITAVELGLKDLAKRFGQEQDTLAKIGDFWLHRSDLARARAAYEAGAQSSRNASLYAGRRAELLMAENRPDDARALIDSELTDHPGDPLLRAYQSALAAGIPGADRQRMRAQLESVVAQMPNSAFVHLHLGRAYLLGGDPLRAGQQLRTAVALDPNYAPGWLALAELEIHLGEASQAQEQLSALLRRAPGYTPARLLQARASLAQRKPAEAEKALESLRQADPDNVDIILTLARAKMALGRTKDAIDLLESASKRRPGEPGPVLLQARMQIAMGDSKGALKRLLSVQPQLRSIPEVSSLLGSVALLARDNKTAHAQFENLVRSSPENLEYRLGYATSLALLGQTDRAKEEYRRVQEKAGNDPQPWLLYASLLSSGGNRAGAIGAYQEAVQRDAKNPYALNNLAFLMAREGKDLKKALQLAEEARRVMPRSVEINDTLAYLYLLLDMRLNAVATLEQLSSQNVGASRQRNLDLIARINRGDIRGARAEMERASNAAVDEGI